MEGYNNFRFNTEPPQKIGKLIYRFSVLAVELDDFFHEFIEVDLLKRLHNSTMSWFSGKKYILSSIILRKLRVAIPKIFAII